MRDSLGVAGLALCLVLWIAHAASAPMTSEQEENMPDFGNPAVASRLKCR